MYRVLQQGHVVYSSDLFVDAWLYVKLESKVYCVIVGPNEKWIINPMNGN